MNWTAWAVETTKADQLEVALLVSGEVADEELRAPVMVNLVLDRSGSMKGAPLSAAVEAAQQLVELARPDDFLGLVLFDGVVEQRVPIGPMDAKGKRQMVEALQGVQTGRGTALYQAVELALRGVQRTACPRAPAAALGTDRRRALGGPRLTGGLRSAGPQAGPDGVAVHALGLAKHYVAEVLDALTQPSGNAFEHVDGPEGLAEAMGGLVAHLFGQVATDALRAGAALRVQLVDLPPRVPHAPRRRRRSWSRSATSRAASLVGCSSPGDDDGPVGDRRPGQQHAARRPKSTSASSSSESSPAPRGVR